MRRISILLLAGILGVVWAWTYTHPKIDFSRTKWIGAEISKLCQESITEAQWQFNGMTQIEFRDEDGVQQISDGVEVLIKATTEDGKTYNFTRHIRDFEAKEVSRSELICYPAPTDDSHVTNPSGSMGRYLMQQAFRESSKLPEEWEDLQYGPGFACSLVFKEYYGFNIATVYFEI